MKISRVAAVVVGLMLPLWGAAQPADAAPFVDRFVVDESWTATRDLCGRDWDAAYHENVRVRVRAASEGSPVDLETSSYRYDRTYVAQDNGDTFLIDGHGTFRLISSVNIGGSVWRITQSDSGATYRIASASGQTIWLDRGTVTTTFTIDTLGDDDPSTNEFSDFEMTWHGPHFFSDTQPGSEFCTYVAEAVATE
jgi:hypothetical protein